MFDLNLDDVFAVIDGVVGICGQHVGTPKAVGKERLKPLVFQRFQPVIAGGR